MIMYIIGFILLFNITEKNIFLHFFVIFCNLYLGSIYLCIVK